MKKEIKVILIVLILLGLGGGYLALNKKIIPVDIDRVSKEEGITEADWAAYDEQERAKAGYPPAQSPQINTDLAYARVEGAHHFDTNNGNYLGVCNSAKMIELKNHIISLGDFTVTCKDKETAWATSVILNSNTSRYWCADSQGNTAAWKEKPMAWNGKTANVSITTSCLD